MLEIKCPNCEVVGKLSIIQEIFEGPYRCWKCRSLFTIKIENNELKSCTPLSEEEFEKWQALQQTLKRQSGKE